MYVCIMSGHSFIYVVYIALYRYFPLLISIRRMVSERRGRGRGRGHLTPPLRVYQTQCFLPWGWGRTTMTPSWMTERWTCGP